MHCAIERVVEVLGRPDGDLDLAEIALYLAQDRDPQIAAGRHLERFEEMALAARARLPASAATGDMIYALNEQLFVQEGFRADAQYNDPANSFLDRVLERRLGINLTLSIVYITVGRLMGLPLFGVAFPGHFLVKFCCTEGDVIIDPCAGGVVLSDEELLSILSWVRGVQSGGSGVRRLLVPLSKEAIAVRLLLNLKRIFLLQGRVGDALWALDRVLAVEPGHRAAVQERRILFERMARLPAGVAVSRLSLQAEADGGIPRRSSMKQTWLH